MRLTLPSTITRAMLIACLLATAAPASAAETEFDLAPVGSIPDAPAGGVSPSSAVPTVSPTTTTDDTDAAHDLDGTRAQRLRRRAELTARLKQLQEQLVILSQVHERAETRLDNAMQAIAERLVALFDSGDTARLEALMNVREAGSADLPPELIAALGPQERPLIAEQNAATDAATTTGASADHARTEVLALGTRIAAIDAALGASNSRGNSVFSVDADYVFATGPIPGIGYWGAVSGGSMLTGWMGYAGAALGGVGCTPPDPRLRATGVIEQGEASWYGPGFHGEATANGETYDQEAMTAAHQTLPFGTIVRVYSSSTGRCVFVRINDRGPFVDGRIIDLSHAAAVQLGMSGTAPVQLEVWSRPGDAPPA